MDRKNWRVGGNGARNGDNRVRDGGNGAQVGGKVPRDGGNTIQLGGKAVGAVLLL
ncbi:hypothetical protein [Sporosarcina cyprini]|uniref:hypothetical protein n=1 Tax=Sporosarcina cyprini TaxID=2910523 RepID=UPI001EDE34DE|nr:hypothetical protein [Sporosarcina cyprini]MCG3086594.1 hypothetical protein [Sporosarcina cyprini]